MVCVHPLQELELWRDCREGGALGFLYGSQTTARRREKRSVWPTQLISDRAQVDLPTIKINHQQQHVRDGGEVEK